MKRYSFSLLALLLFLTTYTNAQDAERDAIVNDLLFLADNFAKPAADGAAYQAGAGWFSSAAALETWEVRFSVHGNALFVPSSKKSYTVSQAGDLSALEIKGAQNAKVPSAFGSTTDVYYQGQYRGVDFEFLAFEGVKKGFVPHAFAQATLGLPYNTEFTVRYMPEVEIDNVMASTFGAGLKHNLSQYFNRNEPEDFQLAAGLAYSKFNVNYAFTPVNIQIATLDLIDVDADLWLGELIASKRYGGFEVFGALGVTNSTFDYKMDGTGEAGLNEINTALGMLGDSQMQFKGDIGFNMHFNNFRVSTMATAGKFFNLNLGLHYTL